MLEGPALLLLLVEFDCAKNAELDIGERSFILFSVEQLRTSPEISHKHNCVSKPTLPILYEFLVEDLDCFEFPFAFSFVVSHKSS